MFEKYIRIGGGYSLYSDDRDDLPIFRSCNRRFSNFSAEVVQAKSIKKIKPVFARV